MVWTKIALRLILFESACRWYGRSSCGLGWMLRMIITDDLVQEHFRTGLYLRALVCDLAGLR